MNFFVLLPIELTNLSQWKSAVLCHSTDVAAHVDIGTAIASECGARHLVQPFVLVFPDGVPQTNLYDTYQGLKVKHWINIIIEKHYD